jgi:hypothetical protein
MVGLGIILGFVGWGEGIILIMPVHASDHKWCCRSSKSPFLQENRSSYFPLCVTSCIRSSNDEWVVYFELIDMEKILNRDSVQV